MSFETGDTTPDARGLRPVRESRWLGQQVGDYLIEDVLGRGGMGVVFRARRATGRTRVALKVLLAGPRATETQRQRFEREAQVLAGLRHPHIVTVHAAGVAHGHPWMALELVEGGTLEDELDQLPLRSLVERVAMVARAVGFAHRHGVIHRDLKPSNVLIRADDQLPVVTDFGLARDLTQVSDLTRSGVTIGTPLYMAPEQAMGRPARPETDVYALGVILYEGLTGDPPFDAGDGVFALYAAIEKQTPEPPSARADVPAELDRIVLRALAKSPERRYASGDELADALEAWLAGATPRRRPWLPLLALTGLGLLATLAFALRSGPPEPAPSPTSAAAPPPVLPVPPPTPVAREHTVELRPGPLEGVDATIRNDGLYANDNFGSAAQLLLGSRASQRGDFRALLRLDQPGLPDGAVLGAASLELTITNNRLERPITLEVRLVLPTRNAHGKGRRQTPWVEGTSGCDRFLDGVCWSGDRPGTRFPDGTSRKPEFSQPSAGAAPLDRVTVHPRQTGALVFDIAEAARAWLARPDQNHGLRLSCAQEGAPWDRGLLGLGSSDHPERARRPRWVLRYVGGPPLPRPDPVARRAEARRLAEEALQPAVAARRSTPAARAAAQRACALAPFWGLPYFHRARLNLLAFPDTASWIDLNHAERAPEPYRAAELYLLRGRALLALGHRAQALRDADLARRAGAAREADALVRAIRASGPR